MSFTAGHKFLYRATNQGVFLQNEQEDNKVRREQLLSHGEMIRLTCDDAQEPENSPDLLLNTVQVSDDRSEGNPIVGALLDNRYRIQAQIGKGATSSVYKAHDDEQNRTVAVKILHMHLTDETDIVRRFLGEANTSNLIQHVNVVRVHGQGMYRHQPYIIMEYAEGQTLQEILKQDGWISQERALNICAQVCAAIAAAHEKNIIHRDLKPSNIIVTKNSDGNDLVRLLDFGIAKYFFPDQTETFLRLTQSGETLGSLLYMSPEQCLAHDLDSRSDIYSVGCILYEMLTGKPPLCGRTAFETMNKQISEMPQSLHTVRADVDFSEQVESVIFKCMAKDPKYRYQTITALQDDLHAIRNGQSLIITNRSVHPALSEIDNEHSWTRFAIAAAIILIFTGVLAPLGGLVLFVSCGFFSMARFKKYARPFVQTGRQSRMVINSIEKQFLWFNSVRSECSYKIDLIPMNSEQAEIKQLRIDAGDERSALKWQELFLESKQGNRKIVEVYFDNKQRPVAVSLNGAIAWRAGWWLDGWF